MRSIPATPSVGVDRLTKRYGPSILFDQASFEVPAGSITAIVGPSGAGKSTFLNIVAGLDKDYAGRVMIGGQVADDWPLETRRIAMLFQQPVIYDFCDVTANILFPLRFRTNTDRHASASLAVLASRLGINHLLGRRPGTLSGGEVQRVALARAFVWDARIRLLDEPIKASLEPSLREELRSLVKTLHSELGGTTVFVTHEHQDALEIADCIVVMTRGRAPTVCDAATVYTSPPTLAVGLFLGGGNVVQGRLVIDAVRAHNEILLPLRGARVSEPEVEATHWLVREESVSLLAGCEFVVESVKARGGMDRVTLRAAGDSTFSLVAAVPVMQRPNVGGTVSVCLDWSGVHGFACP